MSDRRDSKRKVHDAGVTGPEMQGACASWAVLLPEAADGLLSHAEQNALDLHVAGCPGCARELTEAQVGAAWLHMLKDHAPEPPESLLASILAKTSQFDGAGVHGVLPAGEPSESLLQAGAWQPLAFRAENRGERRTGEQLGRWMGLGGDFAPSFQPRLAMTAAMAFFSICLTLNLLGLSVRNLDAEAMHPAAGLQRTVADRGASLVRSFEGIRLVYRVESRVNEWRTASALQDETTYRSAR